MSRDLVVRMMFVAAFAALGQVIGCAWLSAGTYGGELTACTETARTLEQGEACCIESARKRGRDASFCIIHDAGGDR